MRDHWALHSGEESGRRNEGYYGSILVIPIKKKLRLISDPSLFRLKFEPGSKVKSYCRCNLFKKKKKTFVYPLVKGCDCISLTLVLIVVSNHLLFINVNFFFSLAVVPGENPTCAPVIFLL